ncbi:MAG TPA: helix-turn-helix transcriptional regulator [Flavobacteriales bacterium]|nr:helix-turn-helix transcriptional regulator [Flavobacteriales bacterium]MCC6656540.1 helix-turn-helix transcriptional regulator [Flavobacteriales bacterium]HMW98487.1 helix-turn-helix transcriptional regulator [Flavobacteriales bacterium]HMZ49219.1 helix-turn-helix transcriptional regulator [Flavobacteriales bacterium]HNA32984.1 helix-turn-helix transcriptional regulator [Flavobacteriales bacterium]
MPVRKIRRPSRPQELSAAYMKALDLHMAEFRAGTADRAWGIRDFAERLFVHPTHLSNTLQEVTGRSPCDIYEERLMDVARELLIGSKGSAAEVARQLTMDPSNFNKFFKRFEGITPKQFRELRAMRHSA